MKKNRHQNRAVAVFEKITDEIGEDQPELSVPRGYFRIDHAWHVGDVGPAWMHLRTSLSDRLIVFEHYNRSIKRADLTRAALKLAFSLDDQQKRKAGGNQPALLIVSDREPRSRLKDTPALQATDIAGFYTFDLGHLGTGHLVVPKLIPEAIEAGRLLTIMFYPKDTDEAQRQSEGLHRAAQKLPLQTNRLREAIMNGQIPTANNEHWITVEEVKNEGRQEGKRRLVAELLADKFGVIADEATARLADADDARLGAIAKAILRANSIDEVFTVSDTEPKPAE